MKKIVILFAMGALTACTTPSTVMKNEKTGQQFVCGGHNERSILMGVPGYYSQKAEDAECVSTHLEMGYKRTQGNPTESN